jgi:glutathione S-transferase
MQDLGTHIPEPAMSLLTFDNVVFRFYAVVASLLVIKMMSQGWITVFRMIKAKGGYRYPEDAQPTPINPHPDPGQLLPNEYVERSRRMHGNDVENIPLFLIAGLLFVCTGPNETVALALFAIYLLSRLIHFYVVMTARSHDIRATFWAIGSGVVYVMAGFVLWRALQAW